MTERNCEHCGKPLPEGLRKSVKFCQAPIRKNVDEDRLSTRPMSECQYQNVVKRTRAYRQNKRDFIQSGGEIPLKHKVYNDPQFKSPFMEAHKKHKPTKRLCLGPGNDEKGEHYFISMSIHNRICPACTHNYKRGGRQVKMVMGGTIWK